jgi:hypothetical protein
MKSINLVAVAAVLAGAFATPSVAGVFTATNAVPGRFDGSAGTRSVTFSETGTITDLNVTIHFAKCDGQNLMTPGEPCAATGSPFFSEMAFSLVGPDATEVTLLPRFGFNVGFTGGEFTITFDDQAATGLGGLPADGSFQPNESLSAFDGKSLAGLWTLNILDGSTLDALSFYDFTVTATTSEVPEPEVLGLFGLGAAGLGLARRRRIAPSAGAS